MRKSILLLVTLTIIAAVFISGCTTRDEDTEKAKLACIQECQIALENGMDLNNGPCLSDEIIEDWVCDVAHSPRQSIDDDPEYQCPAWQKTAHHFVEVDPECNFIRIH